MKRLTLLLLIALMAAFKVEAANVKALGEFLDNLKSFVTKLMAVSTTAPQVQSTFLAVNPKLEELMEQGKVQHEKKVKTEWSTVFKNLVSSLKPTTETFIGGATFDSDNKVKFQPGIVMALLNMVTHLPGITPNHEKFQGMKDTFTTLAPIADKYGTQVRTLALRLTYIYTIINSVQKLFESCFPSTAGSSRS